MIANVISDLLFKFWSLFYPGGNILYDEWDRFCMSMMAGMLIAAVIGAIALLTSAWFQRVSTAGDVFTLKRPHRLGKFTVAIVLALWLAGFLLLAAPAGKGKDFFFSGGTYVVWLFVLLGGLGIYCILAYMITVRLFSGRYRYVTWLSRKLHRRSG